MSTDRPNNADSRDCLHEFIRSDDGRAIVACALSDEDMDLLEAEHQRLSAIDPSITLDDVADTALRIGVRAMAQEH